MNKGGCRSLIRLNKYRGRGQMTAAGIHMHHCTTGEKKIFVLKSDIQGWHVPNEEYLNRLNKRPLKEKKADTEGNTKVHSMVKQKCLYMIFWEVAFVFESHIFRDLISTIIMPHYSIRTTSASNPCFIFSILKSKVNVQF